MHRDFIFPYSCNEDMPCNEGCHDAHSICPDLYTKRNKKGIIAFVTRSNPGKILSGFL